ncbi:putative lambda repressor-like DNA-binding protein [Bacillus phage phiAGATE]|uniref:Lambda repressor-like DNA-binding protein n=1 Tax=Bacillus phage phiAGATE TaxID=1204533 RepID=L0LA94_9CAUD|nr:transcriptional regulator [Bacillus phage phiAGATE]AGB62617.1 putative lambda repressor-like DNA-binding protein [Bacillus phage phiAGATE]
MATVANKPVNKNKTKEGGSMKTVKRLKKIRMDAGYSIYTLAAKLEVDSSTISVWENGKRFPRRNVLEKLEDLFNVSYRELFEDLTEPEIKEIEKRMTRMYKTSEWY